MAHAHFANFFYKCSIIFNEFTLDFFVVHKILNGPIVFQKLIAADDTFNLQFIQLVNDYIHFELIRANGAQHTVDMHFTDG